MPPSIYDFVKQEEARFETEEIQVGENFFWNFKKHVQLIFHLKNGVFYTGENNWLRAFKNIMEPILNLSYWTEDLELKDVFFFMDESDERILSFLIKKYHDEIYAKTHNLDEMFDEITESDIDYGGVLVQKGVDRPEVLALNSVAFCDQTDILGGPLAFKHYFSPEKLRSMDKFGWGKESNGANISLEDLCVLATNTKQSSNTQAEKTNHVPGKSVEVYIIRGNLPDMYLENKDSDEEYHCNQLQIIAFYVDKKGDKQGVTLYRKKEAEGHLKFFTSKKVYQRALGRGVGETMLHPQIWTNFLTIHKTAMLEAGSKVPLVTDDPAWTQKNKIQDMENLEVTTIAEGKSVRQLQTAAPSNIQLFANEINEWFSYAQLAGAATDPILGEQPSSGTTFRGQERLVAQGKGIHERRRGQRAKFIEDIYRSFIIPDIVKEIVSGKKFLATLTTEELQWLSENIATNLANKKIKELFLSGSLVTPEQQQEITAGYKKAVLKKGNRQLLEILKDEFRDIDVNLGINIAGKQKDLAQLSDKLLSIFQFIFQNPAGFQQAMQIPALAKSFESLLEFGGISISDFSSLMQPLPQGQPQQPQPQGQSQGQPAQLNLQPNQAVAQNG